MAFVGSSVVEKTMFTFVYSSETTEWSKMISVENPNVVVTYPFGTILHLYVTEEMGAHHGWGEESLFPDQVGQPRHENSDV